MLNDWQRQLLGLPPETAYAMPDQLAYAQPDQQPMALPGAVPQQAPAPVAPPQAPPLDMKTADTGQMVTSPFAGIGQGLQQTLAPLGQAVGVVPQPGVTEQPDQYGVLPTERRQAFFDGLSKIGAAMLASSGKMSSADRMAMLAQGLGGFGETARTSALNAAQQRLATTETKNKQDEQAKKQAAITSLLNNPNIPDAVKQALQIDPETVSKALAASRFHPPLRPARSSARRKQSALLRHRTCRAFSTLGTACPCP